MGDSTVYVMAGYIANVTAWETFTADWQAALNQEPSIDYFKMSQALMRQGQFYGWSEPDRNARLKLLAPIINRHALAAAVFVVPTDAWKRQFTGKLYERYHNRPYFFGFHRIMSTLIQYLHQKGIDDTIDFIFDDEGAEPTARILEGFDSFKELAPTHLRKYIGRRPNFDDEKCVLPLQAADMLAWHVRKIFAEGLWHEHFAPTCYIR